MTFAGASSHPNTSPPTDETCDTYSKDFFHNPVASPRRRMNATHSAGVPPTSAEGQASEKPIFIAPRRAPGDDAVDVISEGGVPSPADEEARELVRLIQCPQCSKPFRSPVTLPCGHTSCKACLPAPKPRENISYPDTPDRQTGIRCLVEECGREHPIGEVNVDVVLSKSMEMIIAVVESDKLVALDSPLRAVEVPTWDRDTSEKGVEREGRSQVLPWGRLLCTFAMAALGQLDYRAGIRFEPTPDTKSNVDYQKIDMDLLSRLREVLQKEVECQICYNMMLDPVTTCCGHTFCRRCLTRVLDHSNYCPACRRQLPGPPSLSDQASNPRLLALLGKLCPDTIAARVEAVATEESSGTGELDSSLFVCTLSFPSMPTFLHIFEPRYRLMIRRALDSNRQFGMLLYNRLRQPQGQLGVSEYCLYGTMLRIEHFQMLADGRSIIETRGLYRFRVLETGTRDGYTVGRVERVEDVSLAEEERMEAEEIRASLESQDRPSSSDGLQNGATNNHTDSDTMPLESFTTRELLARATGFVVKMRRNSAPWLHQRILDAYGEPPNDASTFPYWFASVLPIADEEKYHLLTTTTVRQRLQIVVGWIRRLEDQRW